MALKEELKLKRGFEVLEHEAALSVYYTATLLRKTATDFFKQFGLTDVQFNVLSLLTYHSNEHGGLNQAELSDMMLVNRANVTSLIDRMEKSGFVVRASMPEDRRSHLVMMTRQAEKVFAKVEPLYAQLVKDIMKGLKVGEMESMIRMLNKVRENLR